MFPDFNAALEIAFIIRLIDVPLDFLKALLKIFVNGILVFVIFLKNVARTLDIRIFS